MLIFNYKSKKELKKNIGKKLDYQETSMFGLEYKSNGILVGSNRPYSFNYPKIEKRKGREFWAEVKMKNNLIREVN